MKNLSFTFSVLLFAVAGCSPARSARDMEQNIPHYITLYSGGKVIGKWVSVGDVYSPKRGGDNLIFEDSTTHRIVRISGEYVIESAS